jgi:hypothetical protein
MNGSKVIAAPAAVSVADAFSKLETIRIAGDAKSVPLFEYLRPHMDKLKGADGFIPKKSVLVSAVRAIHTEAHKGVYCKRHTGTVSALKFTERNMLDMPDGKEKADIAKLRKAYQDDRSQGWLRLVKYFQPKKVQAAPAPQTPVVAADPVNPTDGTLGKAVTITQAEFDKRFGDAEIALKILRQKAQDSKLKVKPEAAYTKAFADLRA